MYTATGWLGTVKLMQNLWMDSNERNIRHCCWRRVKKNDGVKKSHKQGRVTESDRVRESERGLKKSDGEKKSDQ